MERKSEKVFLLLLMNTEIVLELWEITKCRESSVNAISGGAG